MKVTIFGTGYVGLVQGAILADAGHNVVCVDIDEDKLARLRQGVMPIYEPGLEPIVRSAVAAGRLSFTSDAHSAVAHGEVQFIAAGTPSNEDGSADLKHVLSIARTIATHMNGYCLIVNKSTVPVGTADKVAEVVRSTLALRAIELAFDVVSNPEFLKEGVAVADCQRPDRIVIGTDSPHAERLLRELYEPFNRNHDRILLMGVRSAELTKYAANCMLAAKISFMNEIANLAEKLGADIELVRQGIGSDHRIGYHFIYSGVGYGGSCFPKDVSALVHTAESVGFEPTILHAVQARNQAQKKVLFEKICRHFDGQLDGKTIALWGLSFKPNTDDMREAPSRVLMEALWQAGATVQAFDPEAMREARRIYGDQAGLVLCSSKEEALQGADALAIVTEWQQFKAPDFDAVNAALRSAVIFDGRNLFEPNRMRERGFVYYGIGR
jgi:UDPglucose 6-dehydrogenase